MELRHLRYFTAVAEELHFGHAAERLRIAQSSLSQQIRSLEEELGVKLLQRTKRQVRLTDAGGLFLDDARQVLAQVERMAITMLQASRGETGRLSIGFGPWMDWTTLPELIRRFREHNPDVRLELHILNVLDQVKALLDGRINVGFLRPPVRERSLAIESILREPLVAALPKGHRLAAHRKILVRALADEPFVVLSSEPVFHDAVVSVCREAGFVPKVGHEADHAGVVLGLVSTGIGVSLVPGSSQHLAIRGIVFRALRPAPPRLEILAAWRRADTSPILHAFLGVVREWRRQKRLNR